jgi:hypothetical protein
MRVVDHAAGQRGQRGGADCRRREKEKGGEE